MQPVSTATATPAAVSRRAGGRLWMVMLAATLWGIVGVTTQALYRGVPNVSKTVVPQSAPAVMPT
jgi:hypothetical protein